ncbi:unnamed protein product [Rotaria socialis]|uniref:Major facilitator superfamily (MFS) profile domain-containing protein n=2 Tax=Rotaria socialis TaxID=392032 RepID=A0A818IPR9_9BILA|nr:unnamed protein product [Rotaria socialis]CAF3426854.1 unnamed protein product [Rotaria socialis]CAF3524983.1 unnamed protein product [Rotaria socialis]CAF4247672.1 unnamed protein product [Rotaria socialis]CAF4839203.1 unnamed protein product [Rotaria socialis]
MQSPSHREQYHKHKERKEEDASPTTTIEEEKEEVEKQIGEIINSATPQPTVKNKKRVHYPQVNGDYSATDSKKTDSLQQNQETPSVDLYSKPKNGLSEQPTSNDYVIPVDSDRCCGCCSTPEPFRRRLNRILNPWREFIEYQSAWSWVILVASFLTYSIGEALTSVFPILFVALQDEFPDQGSSRVALVQSMMNAVPCLAGPIASIATTRFGYRKTAMLGGLIGSLSLLATSFARRLELLYLTMGVCYAIGNSLVLVATVVAVTEHFEAKPSFASGVTISGGAFGQCVFAIVLQKLINKYDWNGAMMLFSGVVLSIVAFAALFREVEWDEEDYEEEEGEEEETENGNETTSTALAPSEQSEVPMEATNTTVTNLESEEATKDASSNTPPPTHRPSIIDDIFFYDHYTKQELLDQYSKSEICLPLAIREHYEDEYRQHRKELEQEQEQKERNFNEQKLSSSTTQIEQTDEIQRATQVPPIAERSNSCKNLSSTETRPLSTDKSAPSTVPSTTGSSSRKSRSHHRRQRRLSNNNTSHDNKQPMSYYPFRHQHHNMPVAASGSTRTHSSHHHHHHHHSAYFNRGNLSQLALCSKNIYNYESVLNICKLQSLHFSIDRSLSLPNLYSPMLAGRRRHRSLTVPRNIEDYLKDEEEEEDEAKKKNICQQIYHDICKLVRVLRILPFLLLCVCVTIITIFYDATWTFLIDYMKQNNLTAEQGSHLILAVGIVAIFGEIGYGYLGDSKRISPLYIYACSLCMAGLSQLLIPLAMKSYSLLMPLMLFTSFLQSAQEVLMPILCIKFAGTQNFTNAYGMLLLCQGISSLIGPPALGIVADRNSYGLTYTAIGIGTTFAALLLFTMPLVQRCYGYLKMESKSRKTNTLVTASNGDLPVPITINSSLSGTVANINNK